MRSNEPAPSSREMSRPFTAALAIFHECVGPFLQDYTTLETTPLLQPPILSHRRLAMFHYGLSMLFMPALITYVCATTCYLPDGSAIGGLRTCNPSAPASACCAGTDECTSAGLCKAGNDGDNNWMWRGPCTDKTWQSEDCPRYCYNSTTSK
jgi:hypothetical protein